MKYALIILVILGIGCKKDNTREIEFKWDRPCYFNEEGATIYKNTCVSSGSTIIKQSGETISYEVYSNCSSPKQEAHVTVILKGSKPKKDKIIYESTQVLHKITLSIP